MREGKHRDMQVARCPVDRKTITMHEIERRACSFIEKPLSTTLANDGENIVHDYKSPVVPERRLNQSVAEFRAAALRALLDRIFCFGTVACRCHEGLH